MYAIASSEHFLRRSGKFFRKHPELIERFRQVMEALRHDPFQSGLRLHPLRGQLEGAHAASISYAYRVVVTIKLTEHEIILLDIGTHDEVYR